MTDSVREAAPASRAAPVSVDPQNLTVTRLRYWALLTAVAGVIVLTVLVAFSYHTAETDDPLLVESTPGQTALWMAEQSEAAAPESLLGQAAKNWAASLGQESLAAETILQAVRGVLVVYALAVAGIEAVGLAGLARSAAWSRPVLLAALVGLCILIFIIPPTTADTALPLLLLAICLLLAALLFSPGRVTKLLGFMVVLAALLVAWEAGKSFAASIAYKVTVPQSNWTYSAYPSLDDALTALQRGEVSALVLDNRTVREVLVEAGAEPQGDYPDLRILPRISTDTSVVGLPIIPAFPGRLVVVGREGNAPESVSSLVGQPVGTVSEDFAHTNFLPEQRQLVLLDLKILNNLNLPHLQEIAESLFQPARRNGPVLLLRILAGNGLFTWGEAAVGFISGGLLGFLLGTLFAHFRLMERGLLPYVVASQTVPILAIAPMVVIWLGASPLSVAVISAYLTFFPVTINTLRGLTSPHPNMLELMQSYAASRWTIMWKLRFPAALPYIFTALKVSATSSVVGAIIGELPSGIRDGLGGAILNFNQYYTSDPAKLWAAILIAALVGMAFFILVVIVERIVLPRSMAEM